MLALFRWARRKHEALLDPAPAGVRFLRVTASPTVPIYFMPVMGHAENSTIQTRATSGQVLQTRMGEGVFPFSAMGFAGAPGPEFGFVRGEIYTLRWGSNPQVAPMPRTCPGDNTAARVAQAEAGSNSERGYIKNTSASIIRQAIEEDYMSGTMNQGQIVNLTGGNKQTQRDSIQNRVNQDTDPLSATFAAYQALGLGNYRRVVAVPINSGISATDPYPDNQLIGFASFFLLPAAMYDVTGNRPFCAEYIGSYMQGATNPGAGSSGFYVARLVE